MSAYGHVLPGVHESQGIYITPKTAVTRWAGERMDYDHALFVLFSRRDHLRNVSAETSGA
jgi:hypothetical protein